MRITGRPHVLAEHLDDMQDMRVTAETVTHTRHTGELLGVAVGVGDHDTDQSIILLAPSGELLMIPIDTVTTVATDR
jgi:hypothetical protein